MYYKHIKYNRNSLCIDHIYVQWKNNLCLILLLMEIIQIVNNTLQNKHNHVCVWHRFCIFFQEKDGSLSN